MALVKKDVSHEVQDMIDSVMQEIREIEFE